MSAKEPTTAQQLQFVLKNVLQSRDFQQFTNTLTGTVNIQDGSFGLIPVVVYNELFNFLYSRLQTQSTNPSLTLTSTGVTVNVDYEGYHLDCLPDGVTLVLKRNGKFLPHSGIILMVACQLLLLHLQSGGKLVKQRQLGFLKALHQKVELQTEKFLTSHWTSLCSANTKESWTLFSERVAYLGCTYKDGMDF